MAFTLPTDLATNLVDNSSTVDAAYFNGVSGMGNAVKAALGTIGYGTKNAMVTASETTTSASYADLTTTTDQVTVAVGSSGMAIVSFGAQMTNSGANYCYIGVDISGATTTAASDTTAIQAAVHSGGVLKNYSNTLLLTGLTAGVTTFKLKYKVNTGTGTFVNRRITAIPLPSTDGTHASATLPIDISSSLSLSMGGAGMNRPTYDSVGAGYKAGGASGSWSHTIGANATALIVSVLCNTGTGVTANIDGSTSLTMLCTPAAFSTGGSLWLYTFGMINPPTGAHTINVANASSYLVANSVAYTNTVAFGAPQITTGVGTTASQTARTVDPARTFYQAFGMLGTYTESSYTQTLRYYGWTSGSTYPMVMGEANPTTGTATFTATCANYGWGGTAVELMPSVPTYSKPTWVGTGVGCTRQSNPGASWIDTVPADANLALVWVSEMPADQLNTCSVTLGGTSMVEVTGSPWEWDVGNGVYERIRCFALLNPTTGPNKTVAVTSNVGYYFHAHSVYYGGVTSTIPATYLARAASGTPSMTVPNSSASHLYAQAFSSRPGDTSSTFTAYTPSSGWRAVHDNGGGGYTVPLAVGDAYGNGGDLTLSATRNSGTWWGGVAIDLSPSALPTPSVPTWVGTGAGRTHVPASSFSWVDTVPANATCAIVWLSVMGSTAASAVTVGGSSATAVTGSPWSYYSGNYTVQAFYLLNPPTGASKTISVSYSGGNYVNAAVTYYGGVTSVGSATSASGAGGTAPSLSVSSTNSNYLYTQAFAYRPTATWDGFTSYNQTKRFEWLALSYDNPLIVGEAVGNGGTLTFSATRTGSTYEWGGVAIPLQ